MISKGSLFIYLSGPWRVRFLIASMTIKRGIHPISVKLNMWFLFSSIVTLRYNIKIIYCCQIWKRFPIHRICVSCLLGFGKGAFSRFFNAMYRGSVLSSISSAKQTIWGISCCARKTKFPIWKKVCKMANAKKGTWSSECKHFLTWALLWVNFDRMDKLIQ